MGRAFILRASYRRHSGLTPARIDLSINCVTAASIIKEDLMMENTQQAKWLCLDCWKRMVAKPGEKPPFPTLRMICDECGAQKVLVTPVRTDMLSHSSR